MAGSIAEVKARHESRLLAVKGVVSVGIGKNPEGQASIICGVDDLDSQSTKSLPTQLEGYPVLIKNVGTFKSQ